VGSRSKPLASFLPPVAFVALVAIGVAGAREARADVDVQLSAGVGPMWMRGTPELKTGAIGTPSREMGESRIAAGAVGPVFGLGGHVDLGLVLDDHLVVPLFGVGGYGAVGSYDAVVTSVDGSIAELRPWSLARADLLGPGIGYRVKRRRLMFSALVRTGLSFYDVGGSVASATAWHILDVEAMAPLVQLEIEACRRLDPVTRICGQLSPRLYDGVFMNGAVFGLRVEWGR